MLRLQILLASLLFSSVAFAQNSSDIVGTWRGVSNSAVYGAGLHHASSGAKEKEVRFRNVAYTLVIAKAKGRNFDGFISSDSHKELVLGAFKNNYQRGVMVNEHGTFSFELINPKTLEICFTQVVANSSSIPMVASCFELQKQ